MRFIEHIRYRMTGALAPAFILLVLFYFGFHAVNGNYGLKAYKDLNAELEVVSVKAAEVRAKRLALEAKVDRLRPDNLDPELLDERARDVLGFSRRDEIVILKK